MIYLIRELSTMFDDYIIDPKNVILSATPSRDIAMNNKDKNILVISRSHELSTYLAESFGLNHFITVNEYITQRPYLCPNYKSTINTKKYNSPNDDNYKIDMIFLYNSPEDYSYSLQVIIDILLSNGIPGNKSDKQVVEFFVMNNDVDYGADYPLPRYASGAFVLSLQTLYKKITNKELKFKLLGKPETTIFETAAKHLKNINMDINTFYMVGDSLTSDISGANKLIDKGYKATLVKTGLYKDGDNLDDYVIDYIGDDVNDVVNHVLKEHNL